MSYKSEYEQEKRWDMRCLLIFGYHMSNMLINPHHRITDTASYFHKSLAATSEDIKIARALQEGLVFTSRNDAIMKINGRRK